MASGWAGDGAVQDQIQDSINDEVARARRNLPKGESLHFCEECGEPIPEARRKALPGVRLCVACQAERDREVVAVRRAVPALPVVPVPGTPIPHRLPGPEKRFSLPPALPARRRKTGTNRTTLTA